jgi:hypothetical protein
MASDWRGMTRARFMAGVVACAGMAGGCASHGGSRVAAPVVGGGSVSGAVDVAAVSAMVVEERPRERTLKEIGAGILSGMDVASSREAWQIGDRVLIGVRATKPTGVTTRLVLVELTDTLDPKGTSYESAGGSGEKRKYEFKSDVAQTKITMFDENGAKLGEATGRFPVKLLGYGPYDGAEPMIGHAEALASDDFLGKLPDEQFDRVMRGWGSLFTFSGSLGKKGMFKQMLDDVIVKPSLLRMILHPSAGLTFGTGKWPTREEAWASGSGAAGLSTIRVPLELTISDRPALTGELLAAEPAAPLSLCGGLIRAWGHRPDDEGVRVDLELLAASRGSGGQEFKKAAKASGGD